MTVEFFGIKGFGPINGVRRSEQATGGRQAGKAEENREAAFSAALQGAGRMRGAALEESERTARVEALKQQVADGSYEPDLHQVASSLLKFLVEEG